MVESLLFEIKSDKGMGFAGRITAFYSEE